MPVESPCPVPGLAVIGAHALDGEALAQELGLEREVPLGRTQRDGDDFFHVHGLLIDHDGSVRGLARACLAFGFVR